ncbi:MAG: hypothetical protein WB425_01345 [Terracidiphilus sp.]
MVELQHNQEDRLFDILNGKPAPAQLQIRDTLFGDIPLLQFLPASPDALILEPWASFARAKKLMDAGETQSAIQVFHQISEMSNLESRHYLQAWQFLRDLGVNPSKEDGMMLLGVVVEVGMPKGPDLLAAYSDHRARYYNFSGAGVIWERPNDLIDAAIDDLLGIGKTIVEMVGVWKENRPAPPPAGDARVNLLTSGGLRFGQGPLDVLGKDSLGGPVLASAFKLMQELIKLTKK